MLQQIMLAEQTDRQTDRQTAVRNCVKREIDIVVKMGI